MKIILERTCNVASINHVNSSTFNMPNLKSLTLAALVFATQQLFAKSPDDNWTALFNGKIVDGWVEHSGKGKYTVEDGMLIGESVSASGNSFLCTTQTFDDFQLELEFKCDALLNSGVQIRSEVFPDARTLKIEGKDIKLTADRVH